MNKKRIDEAKEASSKELENMQASMNKIQEELKEKELVAAE